MWSEPFEEGIDNLFGVFGGECIFFWCAEVSNTGRLRRFPAPRIINGPGVNHDDGGLMSSEVIGYFDDAACIVREPPGANMEIGIWIVDNSWRFVVRLFDNRLEEFRMIGEDWFGIFDSLEAVLVEVWRIRGGLQEQEGEYGERGHVCGAIS